MKSQLVHQEFEALGTKWSIDLSAPLAVSKEEISSAIQGRIAVFEKNYSRFRADSIISQIAKKKGTYILPTDAAPMLELYKKLYAVTDGTFTPLIGQVLVDAGYDADYSLRPKKMTQPPRWEEVLEYKEPVLHMKKAAQLDFGGVGKGYMVDLVGEILHAYKVDSFTVDAGGDILYFNHQKEPLRVGLEHPGDVKKVLGVAEIHNESICASSGNRRKWANFHHIINPHTLRSPTEVIATWVVASKTILADSLATTLFFTDPKKLQELFRFEFLIIHSDYSFTKSEQFPAELYTT